MEYENEAERRLFNPKSLSEIESEMNQRGFQLAGNENLTVIRFQEDAKFKAVIVKTKEEVLKEYQARLGDNYEIELVDEEGLSQNQQAVLVFVKKKE